MVAVHKDIIIVAADIVNIAQETFRGGLQRNVTDTVSQVRDIHRQRCTKVNR